MQYKIKNKPCHIGKYAYRLIKLIEEHATRTIAKAVILSGSIHTGLGWRGERRCKENEW
jgi:hypothetical protein